MTNFADTLAIWLADYYLLSTILLALALIGIAALKQPAHRLAIVKATLVALVVLAALCALPRWSVVHLLTADRSEPPAVAPLVPHATSTTQPTTVETAPEPTVAANVLASQPQQPVEVQPLPAPSWSLPALPWTASLAIAYFTGAAAVITWLVIGIIAARRLRLSSRPAPADLLTIFTEVCANRSPSLNNALTNIELRLSNRIDVAVALGTFRPAILLPANWCIQPPHPFREGPGEGSPSRTEPHGGSPRIQLRSVLAHELAHIRHRDLFWLATSRTLMTALWAQPLFWLLRRRMRLDQESLADAAAAELTGRQRYAEHLVAWARSVGNHAPVRFASAVGLWESPSQLRRRVALLLNDRINIWHDCSRRWRTSAFLSCGLIALVLSLFTISPAKDSLESSNSITENQPAGEANRSVPNIVMGRALDERSQPIPNAEIFIFRVQRGGAERTLLAQQKTDAAGNFRFEKVIDIAKEFPTQKFPPLNEIRDDYVDTVLQAPGHASVGAAQLPQVVAKVGEYRDFMLPPAAKITGVITDPDGKPVKGAEVSVENGGSGDWTGASSARTDADGKYTITDALPFDAIDIRTELRTEHAENISDALPKLNVKHPSFATRQTRIDQSPTTKNVQLARPAILSGRVAFADGKPAAGAVVTAATSASIRLGDPPQENGPTIYKASATADANGQYRIASLPEGQYDLWADSPEWIAVGIDAVAAFSEEPANIPDIVLSKGGLIRARFVDAKSQQPIPFNAADKTVLTVEPIQRPAGRPPLNHSIAPNPDSRFEFRAIPGKPLVLIGGIEVDGAAKWYSVAPAVVTVADGETKDVDVPLADVATIAPQTNTEPANQNETPAPAPTPPFPPPPSPPAAETKPAPAAKQRDMTLIITKHVLLLEGKEIVTWDDVDKRIAAGPKPSNLNPQFYFTNGAYENKSYDAAKKHIWDLHTKYKLKGHSEGSLLPRTGFVYDRIEKPADLVPDESKRVEGVVTVKGKPVAGAEVILLTPADESLSYKGLDVYIVSGRLRNHFDEVVADTNDAGRFVHYPSGDIAHSSLLAIHPTAGVGMLSLKELQSNKSTIQLLPWAQLTSELAPEAGREQSASIRTHLREHDGFPEISLTQYWEDLKNKKPTTTFGFTHVPPIWETSISRDFAQKEGGATGVNGASVSLLPGESRDINLGPLSEKQREMLNWQEKEFRSRREATASPAPKDGATNQTIPIKKVGEAWIAVPNEKTEQQALMLVQPRTVKATYTAEETPAKAETPTKAEPPAKKERTPGILSYGDGKPDGKKSYGGSGQMIRFELPEGVAKVKGIRIHGSRYGLPQAPNEDFEITFLSEKRDEILHTESAPYKLFKRGAENWVRIAFDKEVELPKKFWIALDFNAEQTKGVYVSYDTSTKGEYSRVGKAGDKEAPKETDFHGDWMVQVMLSPPKP